MSGAARTSKLPTRIWRRFRDYRLLRKALRRRPRKGVVVATYPNEALARVTAGRLADEGTRSFVFLEEIGVGGLPVPAPVHVIVRPQDEPAARKVLDELRTP